MREQFLTVSYWEFQGEWQGKSLLHVATTIFEVRIIPVKQKADC